MLLGVLYFADLSPVMFGVLVLLWLFYAPFAPKRKVKMCVRNLTSEVKEWAEGTRLEFNRKLEAWYNDVE